MAHMGWPVDVTVEVMVVARQLASGRDQVVVLARS